MGKLRGLSGQEVCQILAKHGFKEVRRRGSHIAMQKILPDSTITVPVPDHETIKNRYFDVNYSAVWNSKEVNSSLNQKSITHTFPQQFNLLRVINPGPTNQPIHYDGNPTPYPSTLRMKSTSPTWSTPCRVIIGRALPDVRDGLETRAPAHTLRHERRRATTGTGPTARAPASSATSSVNTTPTATPRSMTPWCAWPRTSPCAIPWWTARATSAPSTATPPRPCVTPRCVSPAWPTNSSRTWTRTRWTSSATTTAP